MFRMRAIQVCAVVGVLTAAGVTGAQAEDWQKSYPIAGKASLTLSSGDASVELHACGECRAVSIHLNWRDRKPGDYDLNEFQSGDHVNFELKEKPRMGFRMNVGNHHEPELTVETPAALDLEAKTSDGSLRVSGVQGTLELHTSDGSVDVEDVGGAVRLTASDGSIKIRNVTGTLESRSSDGTASVEGRFTALQVHTSDGKLDVTVADGSQLSTASRIESSDGQVNVRLPRTLSVDLDVHTSDGQINCDLPLKMDGYNSSHGSGHNLRGHLNAGGVPLTIHTSDGNVTITGQ